MLTFMLKCTQVGPHSSNFWPSQHGVQTSSGLQISSGVFLLDPGWRSRYFIRVKRQIKPHKQVEILASSSGVLHEPEEVIWRKPASVAEGNVILTLLGGALRKRGVAV
jgi:hypothetical protein